jgi:hypothetical protein
MVDSFESACVPSCISRLIARKHFDPRPERHPARDVLGIRALSQREGCNLQRERSDLPRPVSGTGRCVLSSIGYRVPVRASEMVLSIQRAGPRFDRVFMAPPR